MREVYCPKCNANAYVADDVPDSAVLECLECGALMSPVVPPPPLKWHDDSSYARYQGDPDCGE
jgi:uncharacterized Zn finger protein